jgi:hypothetical protein
VTRHRPIVVLLVALAVVACTDDDGDADSTVAVDSTTTTVPAPTSERPAATTEDTFHLSAEEEAAFEVESRFTQCMREHGIGSLPDPQLIGNGFMLIGVPLTEPSEEWTAAQDACQPVLNDEAPEDTSAAGWERVVPGGDCQCADGSEFSFWVREANPQKVVFYLQDGGVCFSAETCAPDSDLYQSTIDEGPGDERGIFDFGDERNPFADYSVVFVPYCTGDVHLGDTTTEYEPGLTIQHKGYVNGSAALDRLGASFPDASDVVVVGESAGSVAAPLYGALVSDRLPDARVTVLADGSGSYPDVPRVNELIADWGFGDVAPEWLEKAGPAGEQWTPPNLFIQSGRHDHDIVFARHDYAYDENQQSWYPIVGVPADDLLSLIDSNETQIESAGVNLSSYVAPGDDHTVLRDGRFYTETVNGESVVDWVTRLVAGESVADVHCAECAAG